jgi:hypothetical protein
MEEGDGMTIDPDHGWKCVEAKMKRVKDPVVLARLQTVRDHLYAEATADFDMLMGTINDDPQYHFWGPGTGPFGAGPKGLEAVTAHYRSVYEEGRQVCDWDIDRIVADEECVVTEGWFRQLYPGWVMKSRGADIDDDGAVYEVKVRLTIFWPFDEHGKLSAEDAYSDGSMFTRGRWRKLDPSEVPAAFYQPQQRA